jgi:hypothetical protein
MEKFSVVPEVFYDLIARFAPGSIFLMCLALVIPRVRDELIRLYCLKSDDAPSMAVMVPLFIIVAWFTGFILSVATTYLNAILPGGFKPIKSFLNEKPEPEHKIWRAIELYGGFAANWPAFFRNINAGDYSELTKQ